MSNPFLQPGTPPRSRGDQGNKTFKTPRTPASKLDTLISPQTVKNEPFKTTGNSKKGVLKEPFTPEITPQRNTKGHKRRRSNIDIISTSHEENQITETPRTDLMGFFMPTPSTVGSGRKVITATRGSRNIVHNLDSVPKLHNNLNLQEEIDEDKIDFLPKPSKIDSGFLRTSNLTSIPKSPQAISSPTRGSSQRRRLKFPETPTKQMIDDDLRNEWYGRSKKGELLSDDEEATSNEFSGRIKGSPTENPFISNTKSEQKSSLVGLNANEKKVHETIDYSKYAEYVHHTTGERKKVELLESQQRIKPKKLDFFGA